jgi:hypothetical protein
MISSHTYHMVRGEFPCVQRIKLLFVLTISLGGAVIANALFSDASAKPTCHGAISATGNKIANKAQAEANAKAAWLAKAKNVDQFALWQTGKNEKVTCVLVEAEWYQCTASGQPCGISTGGDVRRGSSTSRGDTGR